MGQALSAGGPDIRRSLNGDEHPLENTGKERASSPPISPQTSSRKKHWAIYKDYFADSYLSPRKSHPLFGQSDHKDFHILFLLWFGLLS